MRRARFDLGTGHSAEGVCRRAWSPRNPANHANGQFGIDTAAILAALSKMQSLMSTYIAAPLRTINQYEQSTAKYEQEVMYPLAAINQAKTSVMQFESQFNQISGLFHVNVSSATLPQSQNLESLLLSRNAANVPTVSGQFQSVYGVVMPQNAASPQMRTMTDMTDAQAQDAMKRAIEIDALADAELNEANQMGQQISQAAPGQRSDPRSRGRRMGRACQCVHAGSSG